jgi:hypothetical protein
LRRRVTIAMLVIVCATLVFAIWPKAASPEPIYKGRVLSDWLKSIPIGSLIIPKETKEALQTIGTNGIAFYLRWMDYRPGCIERAKSAFNLKTGGLIQSDPLAMEPRMRLAWQAHVALVNLGARGQCAIPQILEFITNSPEPSASGPISPSNPDFAISILSGIGRAAVPAICSLMTNTHLRPDVRVVAIVQPGMLPLDTNSIASLNTLLTDPNPKLREAASSTLHIMSHPHSKVMVDR